MSQITPPPPTVVSELAEFFGRGPSLREIAEVQASEAVGQQLESLIRKSKTEGVSEEEEREIRNALAMGHLMRMTKAIARRRLRELEQTPEKIIASPAATQVEVPQPADAVA